MKTLSLTAIVLSVVVGGLANAKSAKGSAAVKSRPNVGRKVPSTQAPQKQQDLTDSLDSISSDQDVIRRAKEMSSETKVEVVQNRAVDRTNRHEFSVNYGTAAFGDNYLSTRNTGFQYDYHIDNHWSIGGRYYSYANGLTSEGERVMADAKDRKNRGLDYRYPQIDEPAYAGLATVTWYPIYGKSNMFNVDVVHFDFYTVGGYGRIQLNSGQTDTFTAGGGFGIWWTQWLTSRLEMRWQTYRDKHFDGPRTLNLAVAHFGLGVMF
jgi:outer membrane beta-barrel protein